MQHKDEKTLYFQKKLGELIAKIRTNKTGLSCSKLANEYEMHSGHLNMIENGQVEIKVVTLWKICQALGMKFSEFAKLLEDELDNEFTLIDL